MSLVSASSTTSPSRTAPTRAAPPARKVTSLISLRLRGRGRGRRRGCFAPEPLADQSRAFAHQLEDLLLDLDPFLARPAERAEEAALGGEDGVGDKGANLQQPGHAAARKPLLRVGRVVRPAFDHETAHALRPW